MTRVITITGFKYTTEEVKPIKVTVHYTSDKMGKTLSLTDINDNLQLTVPFEPIEEMIKECGE